MNDNIRLPEKFFLPAGVLADLMAAAATGVGTKELQSLVKIEPGVRDFLAACIRLHPEVEVREYFINELKG